MNLKAIKSTSFDYMKASNKVKEEVIEAIISYPPMASLHEGYAIILEEMDELWEEIKKKPANRDATKLRKEAIQVGAMALRFIAELT